MIDQKEEFNPNHLGSFTACHFNSKDKKNFRNEVIEPGTSCMMTEHSTTELVPHRILFISFVVTFSQSVYALRILSSIIPTNHNMQNKRTYCTCYMQA